MRGGRRGARAGRGAASRRTTGRTSCRQPPRSGQVTAAVRWWRCASRGAERGDVDSSSIDSRSQESERTHSPVGPRCHPSFGFGAVGGGAVEGVAGGVTGAGEGVAAAGLGVSGTGVGAAGPGTGAPSGAAGGVVGHSGDVDDGGDVGAAGDALAATASTPRSTCFFTESMLLAYLPPVRWSTAVPAFSNASSILSRLSYASLPTTCRAWIAAFLALPRKASSVDGVVVPDDGPAEPLDGALGAGPPPAPGVPADGGCWPEGGWVGSDAPGVVVTTCSVRQKVSSGTLLALTCVPQTLQRPRSRRSLSGGSACCGPALGGEWGDATALLVLPGARHCAAWRCWPNTASTPEPNESPRCRSSANESRAMALVGAGSAARTDPRRRGVAVEPPQRPQPYVVHPAT